MAVPTVEGLAYNLYDTQGLICPIMDARRKQVYTGIYRFEDHRLVTVEDQMAVPMEELITKLNAYRTAGDLPGRRRTGFQGPDRRETDWYRTAFAPAHVNKQRAAAVAALGLVYYKEGKIQKQQWSTFRTTCVFLRQNASVRNERKRRQQCMTFPGDADGRSGSGHGDRDRSFCHTVDKGGNVLTFLTREDTMFFVVEEKEQNPWLLQHADSAGRG